MPSRREFLASSALGSAAWTLAAAPPVHAAGSDVIRIGLVGCGGRGSGAALNAMNAGPDVRLTALADLFGDRIATARQQLSKHKPEQVEVTDEQCFIGFDAYQKVIDSGVDVVLIAAASCFHPQHLKAAIDAGKHVFCEKPHGIDVPGIKLS
ncbi:MAG: Gfo/Idh/MocA family protein, partial [Planctomycetota bacterium]